MKEGLRQAIQQVLPAGLHVRVALSTERYGGDDPNNIVNRLSPCGGIQIEQGPSLREDHGYDIADVVVDFLRPPTAPRESWARGIEGALARVWEAAQSLVDRLRGRHHG
ncbi:MAG TPA: poly-gamma-glutamate hydrolase family protein [Acidimicrobiales bacterium]|nr:poly-gamma-glutamate hydrolase family protein [Acidimicrobiales bacterium]